MFKTLAGLERAVKRYDGELVGFDVKENVLRIRWPAGTHEYTLEAEPAGGTRIELQLEYDLKP